MSNFYEKLTQYRDECRKDNPSHYRRIEPVLTQLVNIAFTNELHPDELPQTFVIKNVSLHEVILKQILSQIGLDVQIECIGRKYVSGNSFEITQIRNGTLS